MELLPGAGTTGLPPRRRWQKNFSPILLRLVDHARRIDLDPFLYHARSHDPSMIHYVGVWQWDAYFHALAYRHMDMHLAQDQIRIMLDHQREDGMIPDAVHDEGAVTHLNFPVDADVTKPPLLAWAAWKLYEKEGDREFLNEIYEPIVRWNDGGSRRAIWMAMACANTIIHFHPAWTTVLYGTMACRLSRLT